jgi:hypothetical protein
MLNLSSQPNYGSEQYSRELSDRHISSALSAKPRLPRHISSLESFSHNQAISFSLRQAPQRCPLQQDTHPEEATNLAVNILRFQLQDSVFTEKYLANVRQNLQHRLEVAQAQENRQLATMLLEEFRELEARV